MSLAGDSGPCAERVTDGDPRTACRRARGLPGGGAGRWQRDRDHALHRREDCFRRCCEHLGDNRGARLVIRASPFEIHTELKGDEARLTLVGELDIATVQRLEEAVEKVLSQGARTVVVDLSPLAFMDSS